MEKDRYKMNLDESERSREFMDKVDIIRVTDGLGFGSGNIGVSPRIEAPEDELNEVILAQVDTLIESSQILVPIDKDDEGKQIEDDGCGDGRGVGVVRQGNEIKKRSLHRSKIFGGGATMGVAAEIANGNNSSLEKLFGQVIDQLDEHKIAFGAHTDDHAHGENCGCGAIDKAPAIIANAIIFRKEIEASIEVITGTPTADNPYLKDVFDSYEKYSLNHSAEEYSGSRVMGRIIDSGKIVKELIGSHLEARIVINTVPNTTVNQGMVRDASEEKAQVFAVDEWRLKQLAENMYVNEEDRNRAYFGMLVYTLATAGTLTIGDLKVYAAAAN